MTGLAWLSTLPVGVLTVHSAVNAALLRRPSTGDHAGTGVSVLIPARDEAASIGGCVASVLAQRAVGDLEVIVLDDGSTDATAAVVRDLADADPRLRLVTGAPLPPGWLGKPYACHQLAAQASFPRLVFLDADVVLAPTAVAAAAGLLDVFDLATPYPRIVGAGRLVQPLLQWSWLTFLPLRAMERSGRPSLAAAGGQFLAVRREAYERAGGHAAVRDRVIEDVELARAVKRTGGRITIADGSALAKARMYATWADLVAGYTKSLWASFRSPWSATAAAVGLLVLYTLPPLVALAAAAVGAWSWAGIAVVAYLLGVAGRVVTARATGGPVLPDALAHPASVAVLVWLLARSYRARRLGRLVWKGRRLGSGLG
jgi:glycosyltransferase involved in cell wall biosynthesis